MKYKAEEVREKTAALCLEAARKAVTLVRDRNHLLPLDKNKIKRVSIIVSTQRRLKNEMELKHISDNSDLIIYAAYVNLYGQAPVLLQAFTEAIFGEIPFAGKSPVNLEPPVFVYRNRK